MVDCCYIDSIEAETHREAEVDIGGIAGSSDCIGSVVEVRGMKEDSRAKAIAKEMADTSPKRGRGRPSSPKMAMDDIEVVEVLTPKKGVSAKHPKGSGNRVVRKLRITTEDGEVVDTPITRRDSEFSADLLVKRMEGRSEGLQSNGTARGMYAGEAPPETHLAIFKRNMASPLKGVPWKYPTAELLEKEVQGYFECMVLNRIPLTVAGLCAWLGISSTGLSRWRSQQDTYPLYPTIETAVAFIHAMSEQGAVDGNVSGNVYGFLAKNYWGMTDTMTVTQVSENKGFTSEEQRAIIEALPKTSYEDVGEED